MNTAYPHIRRSPLSIVAGIILVVAGALVSVGIYSQVSTTQTVIAVVNPVARGERIERADLTTAQVGYDPLLKPLPASMINDVIGRYATADLVAGSFLVSDCVGDQPSPRLGEATISVGLMAGEYPDEGLRPGDLVLLVALPDRIDPEIPPPSFPGTLLAITGGQGNSMTVFTVVVDAQDAPTLAALSSTHRLALVQTTRES
ncbi:MAG: SAF domain-containing protein [Propionibacteriaceae bacterium]|nr:SAF domain-containing protein [Propionibacteriaceae bacterium]